MPGVSAVCPQTGLSKSFSLASGSTNSNEESQCWVPFILHTEQKLGTETQYKGWKKAESCRGGLSRCRNNHKFLHRSSGNVKRSLSWVILLLAFFFLFFFFFFFAFFYIFYLESWIFLIWFNFLKHIFLSRNCINSTFSLLYHYSLLHIWWAVSRKKIWEINRGCSELELSWWSLEGKCGILSVNFVRMRPETSEQ